MLKELALFGGSCFCALLVRQIIEFRRAIATIGDFPGYRLLLPAHSIGSFLPRIPFVTLEREFIWVRKYTDCLRFGYDAFSHVSFWPVSTTIFTADAEMIKEITSSRARFPKSLELYKVLSFYGNNLLVTEGAEWAIHRKITNPAFSEKNNRLVWRESSRLMEEMIDSWGSEQTVREDNVVDLTKRFSLLVLGIAGFGQHMSWQESPDDEKLNHQLTFPQALAIVSRGVWFKLLIPGPFWGSPEDRKTQKVSGWAGSGRLGEKVQTIAVAYAELREYMTEMIATRRNVGEPEEHSDLFSNLLRARDEETGLGAGTFTDDDLIGNIFIFLIAGHETSAHALAFAFGLLALDQDEQEKVYQSILVALPDGRSPLYEDIPALAHVLAVFYETLRIYPPVTGIPKTTVGETVLSVRPRIGTESHPDETRKVVLPPGINIIIDVPALHNNPRYWDDPWSFRPERFLGDWPRDAFMAFSAGPRSCVGRKFAETEAIAMLTHVLLGYRIHVDEKFPEIPGETPKETRERLLAVTLGISLCPAHVPLKFVRR